MTIDEAIEQERKQAEMYRCEYECDCDYYGKDFIDDYADELDYIKKMHEHEQRAKWLEDLKVYKQHEIIYNNGYNKGYNKAIDDMLKMTKSMEFRQGCIQSSLPLYEYLEIKAQQLKEGGTK